MKVIENIELLKRLQPVLKDVETEYYFTKNKILWEYFVNSISQELQYDIDLKTLTFEEILDLFQHFRLYQYSFILRQYSWKVYWDRCMEITLTNFVEPTEKFDWETRVDAGGKMLEYLLDNNLLTK